MRRRNEMETNNENFLSGEDGEEKREAREEVFVLF
jgi:hypothetical protein